MSSSAPSTTQVASRAQAPISVPASRLTSLDVFRGATIALMILVNNPGDELTTYWPLKHAEWNGWTPTDLVFPFFLFTVGVSLAFSFSSRIKRGESRRQLLRHGLALFAIGLFLNGFPNHYQLASWRVYGVLQRIAICYVISSILVLWSKRRAWILITLACLAGYWLLMRFMPVPGFGVPTHDMPILDPDRNIAAWLDRKLLMGHLYEGTRDPEGVLSTIPAVATCLLGVLTGDWLRSARSARSKAFGMAVSGVIGVAAGEIINVWLPINKKLWTSSFVLLTAGLALIALALCYWALDMKGMRDWWSIFFLIFGMNAIAAYVFAEIISHLLDSLKVGSRTWQEFGYQQFFANFASPPNASLLYGLSYVLMCWIAMWVLYRKRIFIKI
jgi:predicted acyltransferase